MNAGHLIPLILLLPYFLNVSFHHCFVGYNPNNPTYCPQHYIYHSLCSTVLLLFQSIGYPPFLLNVILFFCYCCWKSIWIQTDIGYLICNYSTTKYRKDKYEIEKQIERSEAVIKPQPKNKNLKFTKTEGEKLKLNEMLIAKTKKLLGIKGYLYIPIGKRYR